MFTLVQLVCSASCSAESAALQQELFFTQCGILHRLLHATFVRICRDDFVFASVFSAGVSGFALGGTLYTAGDTADTVHARALQFAAAHHHAQQQRSTVAAAAAVVLRRLAV
jgi:hypothetical protein